jgi:predicted transporter
LDLTWLTVSGVLIGILVFSFKVSLGCGLASLSRREMLSIAVGYLVISLFMGMAINLLPENTFSAAISAGMAVHLLVALLLVALGTITAKGWNSHCHDISRKTFWALSLPCPACLAASFISCSFMAGLVEIDTWKIGLLVGFLFFFSIAAFSTALRRIKADPSSLGKAMIFLGLFYILSILLIPAYINCQRISFLPPGSSAGEIISSYLMILSLMALGFLGRRWGVYF